jgi:predicted AlkP superfamily pyrophosphatase or phosphodiesterase
VIRKTRLTALLASMLACAAAAPALAKSQPAPAAAPPPAPKLVLAIAVDQFSADLFAQYREHYTGGLARLLKGAVYPSAFQSHAATETCPGHRRAAGSSPTTGTT